MPLNGTDFAYCAVENPRKKAIGSKLPPFVQHAIHLLYVGKNIAEIN